MGQRIRRGVRRAAWLACAVAALWAVAVVVSGGVNFQIAGIRVSSRRALNPAIAALVAAMLAWAISTTRDRRAFVAAGKAARRDWLALALVAVASVSVVSFGLSKGLFVAAGADAYGYVSQADLWVRGSLIVPQPFAREMTWPNAAASLAPLGYRPLRPAPHGTDIVPIYAPGISMLMAVFKTVGGARAVYFVVPLIGGLTVWITFLLGRRFGGPFVGAAAAVLFASCPTFLFEITSPTSDIPATAWWSLTMLLLTMEAPVAALGAGAATAMAILTRPNLAPLAAIPGVILLIGAIRAQSAAERRLAIRRVVGYTAFVALAGAFVAYLNSRLYGSPLANGYGSFSYLYAWENGWTNLTRYTRWLVQTQTPIVFLALAAPFIRLSSGTPRGDLRRRETTLAWLLAMGLILGLYLFYRPYEDAWWYLRFLMPMAPPLFVLTCAVIAAAAAPLRRLNASAPAIAAITVVGMLGWHGVSFAAEQGASEIWRFEQRYVEAGEYVASRLPARAALISMQHSGSGRFYSGRLTVRYDRLDPAGLDFVIGELRRLGYHPYFVLDDAEEAPFRERFAPHSPTGSLNWLPVAMLHRNVVRIYDPADGPAALQN